ncbi:ileal sodium/bile acid cotransporter-like [Argiope bruennichi]|uniref:ileal sodium/bile acid cotransporter-like n=1 Tax=Argiope bruennichi TaxID=94029 RepID=UPI002494CCEF|nr:ileal sodium/bile acid cotransporter-like [Argiope bruennichi]
MKSVVLLVFITCQLCVQVSYGLNITFNSSNVEVFVDDKVTVLVIFNGAGDELEQVKASNWTVFYEPRSNLEAEFKQSSIVCDNIDQRCIGEMDIKGLFLGFGTVTLARLDPETKTWIKLEPRLVVTIIRLDKLINKIFIAFVAIVVSLNNVNMGCALDLGIVKDVLKRPIGPAIGCFCQFVIMPLVSYGVGYLIFEDPVMRLGLFTFGSSPAGGASNMWTVLLGGNLNLSITMTFISTIAALGTIPFWLFTLGKTIITGTKIVVPFQNIIASLASLMIPIGIGILIQRRFPKVAARSKRILAPVCIILLICIVVLASIANSYMFYLLTWRMAIAASLSVWTGFAAGILVALVFRFSRADIIAIAVETGIQNSGIAFVLLSYSLKPPVSDIASVVPVAGSIITPIPLFVIYCFQKIWNRCHRNEDFELQAITSKRRDSDQGEINLASDFVNK